MDTRLIKQILDKANKKPKKKTEGQLFELPKKYTKGLSQKETKEKTENVKETKKLLKEGKKKEAYELASKRPTTKKTKQSSYTTRFKKDFPSTKVLSENFFKKTGIPLAAQKEIVKRGMGAFASAGSRASVSSPQAWSYARLYAFYYKLLDNKLDFDLDIVKKYNIKSKK